MIYHLKKTSSLARDADSDGYVSAQDIVDFLLSGSSPTPEELLSEVDTDGSEGISWEEFVADWNSDEDINDPDGEHLDNNAFQPRIRFTCCISMPVIRT